MTKQPKCYMWSHLLVCHLKWTGMCGQRRTVALGLLTGPDWTASETGNTQMLVRNVAEGWTWPGTNDSHTHSHIHTYTLTHLHTHTDTHTHHLKDFGFFCFASKPLLVLEEGISSLSSPDNKRKKKRLISFGDTKAFSTRVISELDREF